VYLFLKIDNDEYKTADTRPALFKNGRYMGAEFILQKKKGRGSFGKRQNDNF
jgi:hypothetical protein